MASDEGKANFAILYFLGSVLPKENFKNKIHEIGKVCCGLDFICV
jgi:hypothetical protein